MPKYADYSETTREKKTQWEKANRKNLSCNVPIETAEKFKTYCENNGKTVRAAILEYIESCISNM